MPAAGVRVTHRGKSVAYSGDTGPCATLNDLAASSDLFICEAGAVSDGSPHHCTPEDAACAGKAASELILTHLSPGLTAAEASRRAGQARVARSGDEFTIGQHPVYG